VNPLRRFARFNAVGALGVVVQLVTLSLLLSAHLHYSFASVAAVAAALVHNFAWHVRWTWRDRAPRGAAGIAVAFGRFVSLNGAVSMIGTLVLMPCFVGLLHLPPIAANLLTIAVCGCVNFGWGRVCFPQRSTARGQVSA